MTRWGAGLRQNASLFSIFAAFFVLSLIFCSRFFDLSDPNGHCMMSGDPALNAWALDWVTHALKTSPRSILDGNTFFPYPKSIALSEHMLSLSAINVFLSPFSSSPWFGYNVLLFLSYFVSSIGGFLVVREWTGSTRAAIWAGIFWGFLFFRVHHISHLQILSFEWIPFSALFLVRALRAPTFKNCTGLVFFFLLQALVSWYLAIITAVLLLVVAACNVERSMLDRRHFVAGLVVAIVCAAPLVALAIPYAEVSHTSTLTQRYITALSGTGIHLDGFFWPPGATLLGTVIPDENPTYHWVWGENTLYIGYVPLLLALVALTPLRERTLRLTKLGVVLIVVGVVFALGFVFGNPGVKMPLYYLSLLAPPLAGLRATQRFSLLIYFGVMLLSASTVVRCERRFTSPHASTVLVALLCAAFLLEVYPVVLPYDGRRRVFEYTAIDRGIDQIQKELGRPVAAIHYPIHNFTETYPTSEAEYMLGSTLHHASIVNGFSGSEPNGWMDDLRTYNEIPEAPAFELLRKRHVDLICLHHELDAAKRQQIVARFLDSNLGEVAFSDDAGDVILRLHAVTN